MTLTQLRTEAWNKARELSTVDAERLWTLTEMNNYINRVYKKIAMETRCIKDSTTASVCIIASTPVDYTTYTEGTMDYIWANDADSFLYQKDVAPYLYTYNSSIILIEAVKWQNRGWTLKKVSSNKWQENPVWEQVIGDATEYATDLSTGKLAINYRSEDSDYLFLTVRRMPLTDLSSDSDVPEIPISYHHLMMNGILYEMFSKRDASEITGVDATQYLMLFNLDIDRIKRQETILEDNLVTGGSSPAFR